MFVSVQLDPKTRKALEELQATWVDRANGVMRAVTHAAAQSALQGVIDNLPNEPGMYELRGSLRLARVSGLKRGHYGYSVYASTKSRSVEEVDTDRTIFYVKPLRTLTKVPAAVKVVVEHGPWTVDTLPFHPKRKEATVLSRTVSTKAVARIRKDRKSDERVWRQKLIKAGYRRPKVKLSDTDVVVPDVAYESLRYEFGLGGAPPKAHWRPAILNLAKGAGLRQIGRSPLVKKSLIVPAMRKWRAKPEVDGSFGASGAGKYVPFQKTLGIRPKG